MFSNEFNAGGSCSAVNVNHHHAGGVVDHETNEILEDHDLKELLNRLPDEAFQVNQLHLFQFIIFLYVAILSILNSLD